jgi:NTP pyrophosphatase (non-canonical NTP hydrolase)
MDLKEYQQWTITTAIYPGAGEHGFQECNYLTLGLVSEAGEVAGKLKKVIRGDTIQPEQFVSELSDVLWYLTRLCDNVGITLSDLADYNVTKLEERKKTNTLKGSGETIESRIITNNS